MRVGSGLLGMLVSTACAVVVSTVHYVVLCVKIGQSSHLLVQSKTWPGVCAFATPRSFVSSPRDYHIQHSMPAQLSAAVLLLLLLLE